MRPRKGSVGDLVERLNQVDPMYLHLIAAETAQEFDEAFDALLEKAVMHLERNKAHFQSLTEDGLTANLESSLSVPGLCVTREQHSNGHVDLTIQAGFSFPARIKLGEAKIYHGPEYHFKGIAQLLNRYTTGRECRGLLIVYVRKARIADLVLKIRAAMDKNLPVKQIGPTSDHVLKWSFLSTHDHSSGELCEIGHVACNLFVDEKSDSSEPV